MPSWRGFSVALIALGEMARTFVEPCDVCTTTRYARRAYPVEPCAGTGVAASLGFWKAAGTAFDPKGIVCTPGTPTGELNTLWTSGWRRGIGVAVKLCEAIDPVSAAGLAGGTCDIGAIKLGAVSNPGGGKTGGVLD